tara:strand:+ start:375 stop:641 length:267 start_codon:yes stop_codon:yes gene_type:complete
MKKEELFNDNFLKQFKTGDELNGFLKQLQKRGIEKMLEGELDGHLNYDKNQKSKTGNTRNGYASKQCVLPSGNPRLQFPETGVPVSSL